MNIDPAIVAGGPGADCPESFDGNLALRVDGLSKCYRIYSRPRDRLLQGFLGNRRRLYREFWALQPLSFSLPRGETLGVVGRNGSGKSTLLQLICSTLTPSSGSVQTWGRIGALLELGSGFNPEFSGLENVHLNASLLGMKSAEIEARLDDILAFADIGDFVSQPVKSYSSGMVVRLAFAVQAHINPSILVVDEALAVGDEMFQKKCYSHLERLKGQGTSILLVTHSCPQINQHCDRALLLHRGHARLLDLPQRVTAMYQQLINAPDEAWDRALGPPSGHGQPGGAAGNGHAPPSQPLRESEIFEPPAGCVDEWLDTGLEPATRLVYPDQGCRIEDVRIISSSGAEVNHLPFGRPFTLVFEYASSGPMEHINFTCHIASHTGARITGQNFPGESRYVEAIAAGRWCVHFHFQGGLWPGLYFIGGGIGRADSQTRFLHRVVDYRALRVYCGSPINQVGAACLTAAPPELITNHGGDAPPGCGDGRVV